MKRLFLLPLFLFLTSTIYGLTSSISVYAEMPDCTYDGNPTRPGGDCSKTVPFVHTATDKYGVTLYCPLTPAVKEKHDVCNAEPGIKVVDHTDGNTTYGWADPTIFANLNNASLGGYGPDSASWSSLTLDQLAAIYPYNGLADKPLKTTSTTPKESFRTFWRLSSLSQQLKAKAAFFARFQHKIPGGDPTPPIFDSEFPYVPPNSSPKTESVADNSTTLSQTGNGTAISPAKMQKDMQEFFDSGADGYLMWQYSGNRSKNQIFGNDPYSIFSDDSNFQDYCKVFQQFSGHSVGVNMWDAGDPRYQPFLAENLSALKNCGVNTIRIFAKAGGAEGAGRVISAASGYGIQVIVSVGDYSNGGGGMTGGDPNWYSSGDKTEYNNLLSGVAAVATKQKGSVKYIELANEPHCGGDASIQSAYNKWVSDSVNRIRSSGLPISIGQMATSNGVCDQPGAGFISSNNVDGLTGASAHYYDDDMKTSSMNALSDAGSKLSRPLPFYVGEAGGGTASTDPEDLPTFKISELIKRLPACLTTYPLPEHCSGDFIGRLIHFIGFNDSPDFIYQHLSAETKAMYDAFQPFDFDNVRGYIAMQYLQINSDPHDTSNTKLPGSAVLTENLPYVLALDDILNSKQSGVLNMLSPQYFNGKRYSARIAGDKYTNDTSLEYAQKEDYDYLVNMAKLTWQTSVIPNDFHEGPEGCYAQGGPILEAPMTYPQRVPLSTSGKYTDASGEGNNIGQKQWVPVQYTATLDESCDITDPITGIKIPGSGTKYSFDIWDGGAQPRDPGSPLVHWVARALIAFSNPVQTAVDYSISQVSPAGNLSLLGMLLTDGSDKAIQMQGLPPGITHTQEQIPMLGPWIDYTADGEFPLKGVGGKGDLSAAYMGRDGGTAEINLCAIRNFWLRPAGLQKGITSDCFDTQTLITATLPVPPTASSSAGGTCQVKQHLFENTCGGQPCYSYVMNQANVSCGNKGVLNPALVIAIALNENGGLISTLPDGKNPPGLPHFGCFAGDDSIQGKTSCAVGTLKKCDQSDEQILKNYGYVEGFNAAPGAPIDTTPINAIMNVLGLCSSSASTQKSPCFSVFVSESEADSIRNRLTVTLPAQKQTWFNYFKGYIDDLVTKYNCSPSSL